MDNASVSPLDFFETPREAVLPLLPYLRRPKMFVDLGCGRGALGRVLLEHFGVQGIGVEFLPERAEQAERSGAYFLVIRGDVADRAIVDQIKAYRRTLPTPVNAGDGGVLTIGNWPFQQWELFAEVEQEIQDGFVRVHDEGAALLPAMAFERRRTNASHYKKRAAAIRGADGRYDVAERPKFWRTFISGETGKPYIAQKGEAPSAYAWLMHGTNHAGKWRWLETEGSR